MTSLLALIPLSLVLLLLIVLAFLWAVRSGQFDDLDTPSLDILSDETRPRSDKKSPAVLDSPSETKPLPHDAD